jgi:hypothetical protein
MTAIQQIQSALQGKLVDEDGAQVTPELRADLRVCQAAPERVLQKALWSVDRSAGAHWQFFSFGSQTGREIKHP